MSEPKDDTDNLDAKRCYADAEVCTSADVGIEITGSDAQPMAAAINKYLSIFAKPVKRDGGGNMMLGDYECLKCGKPLGGALGSFQWGLAHGEGNCSGCGWPCRVYHRPKDSDGEIFNRALEVILQYHPSNVTTCGNKSA